MVYKVKHTRNVDKFEIGGGLYYFGYIFCLSFFFIFAIESQSLFRISDFHLCLLFICHISFCIVTPPTLSSFELGGAMNASRKQIHTFASSLSLLSSSSFINPSMRLLVFLRRRSSLPTQSSSVSKTKTKTKTKTTTTTTTHCCRCRRYHHRHRRFLLLQQLLNVLAVIIAISIATSTRSLIAATTVSPMAAFNFRSADCTRSIATENKKRELRLNFRRNNDNDNDSCYYWKEIVDDKNTNKYTNLSYNHDDDDHDDNQKRKRRQQRRRLRLLHFGKIQLLSRYDGNSNSDDDDYDYAGSQDDSSQKEKEEHPLRTEIWEMDIKWSFLSPKKSNTFKRKQTQGKKIKLELHPEGYCRIIEVTNKQPSSNEKRNKHQVENIISENVNVVLGIGRWNKGWGVSIIVRPLLLFPLASAAPSADNSNNSKGLLKTKKKNNKKKSIMRIDEDTEYIFHARDFHWNGFGSNPKLTRGTIILEKTNNSNNNNNNNNNICWWKSPTSSRYSSILPVWPEELIGEEDTNTGYDDEGSISNGYLRPTSIVKRLFSFTMNRNNNNGVHRRWFRPIVGTFSAKGII
jgi:hypothetical protein